MLPRSIRLSTKQFDVVMKKGRVVHSSFFLARSLDGQADTRFSAVVPVKVVKKASGRNNSRRIIYSHIEPFVAQITSKSHIAIFAKIDLADKSPNDISVDLKALFVKAGILR